MASDSVPNINGANNPCAKCGLSNRNTVHTNPKQFEYHQHVERAEASDSVWTEREREALDELMKLTDLSEHEVMQQGLRVYQLIVKGSHKLVAPDELSKAASDSGSGQASLTQNQLSVALLKAREAGVPFYIGWQTSLLKHINVALASAPAVDRAGVLEEAADKLGLESNASIDVIQAALRKYGREQRLQTLRDVKAVYDEGARSVEVYDFLRRSIAELEEGAKVSGPTRAAKRGDAP
jgi:hypothetical protein